MSDAYSALGTLAIANPRTIGGLTTATTRRARITGFTFSCEGSPADNTLVWAVQRITAWTSPTAVTPLIKDPLGAASTLTFGIYNANEPTYTASTVLLGFGMNQRSLMRVQYAPGQELCTNLTSANGIACKVAHASATPVCDAQFEWME